MEARSIKLALCLLLAVCPAAAEEHAPTAEGGVVRITASDRYEAGGFYRFFFGNAYRDLWDAEIEVPVLDLHSVGGGLVPSGRFGGLQTAVLGLKAADGRSYTFRGVDKDPSSVLPPVLLDTFVQDLVQDMMATQHPEAPLAVSVLSEAAGLLAIKESTVVIPDDPVLGEYREEFAGRLGHFFEFPMPKSDKQPGYRGAIDIIDHDELYERLEANWETEVAVDEFLRARLFDIFIGDFDRHRKQWRWAKFPDDPLWYPIPEDRDMAFVRYDGALLRFVSIYVPILQDYSAKYPGMKGLTLHGWEQDRWLLPSLSWPAWEAMALDVQSRITDDVIDEAVDALAVEYVELDGDRLRHDLRGRRDRLVEGARAFYEHLAGQVNVEATDVAEEVTAARDEDGSLLLEVRDREAGPDSDPVYSRRFEKCETNDVRVYLRGGDDRVKTTGGRGPIRLRLIAEDGEKVVDDREGGKTRVYEESGTVELLTNPHTDLDTRHYEPPEPDAGFVDVEDVPPRDWGYDLIPIPLFSYEKDAGLFFGLGGIYTRYGFRKHPWSSRHRFSAGYAEDAKRERLDYLGTWRFENSRWMSRLQLRQSGIEVMRFYGYGNKTSDSGSNSFYRVRNRQFEAAPALAYTFEDSRFRVGGGPWVEYSDTKSGSRFIDFDDPYGAGEFGSTGGYVRATFDSRETYDDPELNMRAPIHDNPAAGYPTSGLFAEFKGEVSPPIWDVKSTWGAIEGSVSAYFSAFEGDRATLAVRVGGRETFGNQPYFKAAYIGGGNFFSGGSTVRGLLAERFAGDTSVYGNLDLRVVVARVKALVPSDVGVLGFGDVGRVFEDGESSDKWHPGYGGGVWIAPLARTNALSFTVADSQEETVFYMNLGFAF
jgi:hypothetical protein